MRQFTILWFLVALPVLAHSFNDKFYLQNPAQSTCLAMARSINKQAELRRKMELAKKQKQGIPADDADEGEEVQQHLSDKEIKERNDRKRFEEMLQKSKASAVWNDFASPDDYRNHEQIEEEIDAQRKGIERLYEGDPAPENCFAQLVIPQTDQPLGTSGQERMLPWSKKSAKNDEDYLIIVCDPRPQSEDLQSAAQHLWAGLIADMRQRLVIINADSPPENRRWFKKQGWTNNSGPTVYCDEQKEWMRAHTALGDNRWSMTLFVLASGRVQKLVRELDVYTVDRVVPKAVEAFQEAKL